MNKFWFHFFYIIVWPIFHLLFPSKVVGRDSVPAAPVLLCANHTHFTDPIYILYAMGQKDAPTIMAKAELLRIPVLGWILKQMGVFGVDRGKSDVKAVKTALKVLKDGKNLLVFPEGTRVKEEDSAEAKTGAAMLALRTGVPLVPIWMPAKKKLFRRTPVVFGEAYYPQGAEGARPTPEDYRRVADDLMARIKALGEQYHGN